LHGWNEIFGREVRSQRGLYQTRRPAAVLTTGGYGHGQAIDVTGTEGTTMDQVWRWLDEHGGKYRLHRPMRVIRSISGTTSVRPHFFHSASQLHLLAAGFTPTLAALIGVGTPRRITIGYSGESAVAV
jgi:hypothetical protein